MQFTAYISWCIQDIYELNSSSTINLSLTLVCFELNMSGYVFLCVCPVSIFCYQVILNSCLHKIIKLLKNYETGILLILESFQKIKKIQDSTCPSLYFHLCATKIQHALHYISILTTLLFCRTETHNFLQIGSNTNSLIQCLQCVFYLKYLTENQANQNSGLSHQQENINHQFLGISMQECRLV